MVKKRHYGTPERVLLGAVRDHIDTTTWEPLDEGALSEEHRKLYEARKKGVEAFFRGESARSIKEISGFSRTHIYRLITERCLVVHKDGLPAGWRGLKPHARLTPYTRSAPLTPDPWGAGTAGALQLLFATRGGHELKTRFEKRILGKVGSRERLSSKRVAKQELIVWFLNEAKRLFDVPGEHWPFNREKQGKVTLSKFIDHVLAQNPERARELEGGPEAVKKAKGGDGVDRPKLRLLERVECDAHKLDVRCVVNFPNPEGGWSQRLVHRIWVIVIVDVASRSVLGYTISIRREPTKEDVLRAVRNSLRRWAPRVLTHFSDRTYHPEAGFPSKLNPEYVGACWGTMSVDGALANTCRTVRSLLKSVVNADLISPLKEDNSFAQRRSLDDRPYIETFFRVFPKVMSRLSPGTGANPKERRGRNPEDAAAASNFQLEHLEDLLDVLVANYNGTPHSSLGYRSPLQQFAFLADREPGLIRTADPGEVSRLLSARKKCRILATQSGAKVHINFYNAEYSAEWLKSRRDLFGEYVDAYLEDEYDARFIMISYQGQILGSLRASPPWHQTPHTLYMRAAIKGLSKKRIVFLSSIDDPIKQLCEAAERETDGVLRVHPAYLEARRVFSHVADKMTNIPESSEKSDASFADNVAEKGKVRNREATESAALTATAETQSPIARRKAINTGRSQ